ncbi:MAG: OprD family outer membrane porin [Pseudomonadales bacterium]
MKNTFSLKTRLVTASLLTAAASQPAFASGENGEFFGNLRLGYISAEDDTGIRAKSSAIGGKFGYLSPQWNGLSAGATVYATEDLGQDDEGSFFGADGDGYAILGEAYLQAHVGNNVIKGGRFEYDSPFADTDDIRMVPNTFQGAVFTNTSLADTTLQVAHLRKWAGVDTDEPEEFRHLNDDEGVNLIGAVYEGFEALSLQAWYYDADELAQLSYFEAVYSGEYFEFGAQFSAQNDDTSDNSGTDGDIYGIFASVNISDFTLAAAYNEVDGTATDGFGGGPFYTSADELTIAEVEDQDAFAAGLEYTGIEGLTLGILNVNFGEGEDETEVRPVKALKLAALNVTCCI